MIERLFRFNLIARCFALLCASITCYLGWFAPSSLTARVLEMSGATGQGVLAVMTAVALIGIADVIVNDLMPQKYALRRAARNRHSGFNLLGVLYVVMAVPGLQVDSAGAAGLVTYYVGVGLLCGWLAWAMVIRSDIHRVEAEHAV